MKFNFNEVYQIESGASKKKIYRFKNTDKEGVLVDFSYNYKDYHSFLKVNKFLSTINISVPKIFDMTTVAYVSRPNFIKNNRNIFNGRVKSVLIPKERAIDIDDEIDFKISEILLKERIGDKK